MCCLPTKDGGLLKNLKTFIFLANICGKNANANEFKHR